MRISRTPEITIFVRHSRGCPYENKGAAFQGCSCGKHLRWSDGKQQYRVATKSRTWEGAMRQKLEIEKRYYATPSLEWHDEITRRIDRLTELVEALATRMK